MPIFLYKAFTRAGRRVKGDLDAPSLDSARKTLERRGLKEIRVRPKPRDILEGTFLEGRVTSRDMVVFSREFATLINSGVPILQTLEVLGEQTENKILRRKLYEVKNDIESGLSLHESLEKHPEVFDDLYTNLVQAGEAAGVLDTVLERLAQYMEKTARLKSRMKNALIYPGVIITVAAAVIAIILIFVIPTFEEVFADFGEALPAPTRMVIDLSGFVTENFVYALAGLLLFALGAGMFYRSEPGRILVDRVILFLPVFGPLLRKAAVARFSRTMSTMISSGVPILSALDIVSRATGNRAVEQGVLEASKSITEGQGLAGPLEETGIFPPMVVQMISIGETTGALDAMLEKAADFYDDQVDAAVDTLTSLLEPVMIVFLGLIVGGLVVSMYLPVFQIADVVA